MHKTGAADQLLPDATPLSCFKTGYAQSVLLGLVFFVVFAAYDTIQVLCACAVASVPPTLSGSIPLTVSVALLAVSVALTVFVPVRLCRSHCLHQPVLISLSLCPSHCLCASLTVSVALLAVSVALTVSINLCLSHCLCASLTVSVALTVFVALSSLSLSRCACLTLFPSLTVYNSGFRKEDLPWGHWGLHDHVHLCHIHARVLRCTTSRQYYRHQTLDLHWDLLLQHHCGCWFDLL